MAIMNAVETIITGLVGLVIIGGVIIAMYPILYVYYSNEEVFLIGAVVLALVGLIALVFMIGLYKQIMADTETPRQQIRDTASGFRRE